MRLADALVCVIFVVVTTAVIVMYTLIIQETQLSQTDRARCFMSLNISLPPQGRHGVTLHSFADDTQLYLHCHREDTTAAAAQLTDCVVDVSRWMTANRLSLNADKTELLWTGSQHSLSQFQGLGPALQLGADTVAARDQVRLLGSPSLLI